MAAQWRAGGQGKEVLCHLACVIGFVVSRFLRIGVSLPLLHLCHVLQQGNRPGYPTPGTKPSETLLLVLELI